MISARDLRDMLRDMKLSDMKLSDVKIPEIGRRSEPPALLWLGLGLALGTVIGMLVALLATPYSGDEARKRLGQRVEQIKTQREREHEFTRASNGGTVYSTPTEAV